VPAEGISVESIGRPFFGWIDIYCNVFKLNIITAKDVQDSVTINFSVVLLQRLLENLMPDWWVVSFWGAYWWDVLFSL
jgi:hypothetical protein